LTMSNDHVSCLAVSSKEGSGGKWRKVADSNDIFGFILELFVKKWMLNFQF